MVVTVVVMPVRRRCDAGAVVAVVVVVVVAVTAVTAVTASVVVSRKN
ncbi:hypothetical protein N9S81_00155 [bacterium]|nr:hypothetical protein [bacterium]